MCGFDGSLRPLNRDPIEAEEMVRLLFPMLNERNRRIFDEDGGADFAYTVDVDGTNWRFRVNMLQQLGKIGLVARRINNFIPDFEGLQPAADHGEAVQIRSGNGAVGRRHRIGKKHDDRLDAELDQPQLSQTHSDAGRSDRIHLHRRQVPDQPAGNRHGREGLRDRHEACGARRSGRDAGGRNA